MSSEQPVVSLRQDNNAAEMMYGYVHKMLCDLMKRTRATFSDDTIYDLIDDAKRYNGVVDGTSVANTDDDFNAILIKSFDAANGLFDNAMVVSMPLLDSRMPFESGTSIGRLFEQATSSNNTAALRIISLARMALANTFRVKRVKHEQNTIKHMSYEQIENRRQNAFFASYRTLQKYGRILFCSVSASRENDTSEKFSEVAEKIEALTMQARLLSDRATELEEMLPERAKAAEPDLAQIK